MKRSMIFAVLFSVALVAASAMAMSHGGKGCHYCGMSLEKFAHTAMTIEYDDGSKMSVCSLHCAAIDLALNIDKTPVSITVGDYHSKEKINAETAFWVIDSSSPGVMTSRAKWAFKNRSAAESYIDVNCASEGMLVKFEQAMRMAYEDMYKDTQMIRKKRKMMKSGGMK